MEILQCLYGVKAMRFELKKVVDRRRGPDILVKWVRWTGLFAWIIVIIIYVLITSAKPDVENFVDKFLNVQLRKTWDITLMHYAFGLMVALFILCLCTLFINAKRQRRKEDKYSFSIILLGVSSVIGIVYYLIKF